MPDQPSSLSLAIMKSAANDLEQFAKQREEAFRSISPLIESMSSTLRTVEVVRKAMEPHLKMMAEIQRMTRSLSTLFDVPKFEAIVLKPEVIYMKSEKVSFRLHPEDRKLLAEDLANVIRATRSNRNRASYPLPKGANVDRLRMKFVDGHTVKLKYPGMPTMKFDYKDMGFVDRKTQNPDTKWEFMRAIADNGGKLPISKFNKRFSRNVKYEVSRILKAFLETDTDLFYPYRKQDGYYPRFAVIPESDRHPFDDESVI